ncbi:MAG: heme lyase CcmF/NrfE family subunit [Piscirickettsiaceae bacterium]|nr:heme lyase CcmF/NrfE family subunit [Piscirickettsiaceae bacterium]
MIIELGQFSLILALCLACIQMIVPLVGAQQGNSRLMAVAKPVVWGQFLFVALAFVILTFAFISDDFSVRYVAQHGNTQMPLLYKVSAVWGAHEGSLLLWVMLLAAWGAALTLFTKSIPVEMMSRVIAVMGMISIGFLAFMIFTSNPFERLYPLVMEGQGLNALLQDPGLALHPPLLYMGYVGFSVAFSFAIAALIGGNLDSAWARVSRPWTIAAWVFLTAGITLGSWWAYNELGWGGWWFWDPVENASLMPWLLGTALIHSLAVTDKRAALKRWTVLLAILAFSASLLGTFIVRSGVLTSVHAFATDPERGVFILAFLFIVIGGSLTLYAWRAPSISLGGRFNFMSRESFILANNVLILVIAAFVLLGTLYPLIYDAMGWGKISVGFPWFNQMLLWFSPLLLILLGIGPVTHWRQVSLNHVWKQIRTPLVLTIVLTSGLTIIFSLGFSNALLGLFLALWVLISSLSIWLKPLANGKPLSSLVNRSASYYGMLVAHFGVGILVIGITFVSSHEIEKDLSMAPGDSYQMASYLFTFEGVKEVVGTNYVAQQGIVNVFKDDILIAKLRPEKREYSTQTMPMTEAAIDVGIWRDLYVSLGDEILDGAWSLRLYYKPFVRWIWAGGLLIALGGFLAGIDRRYRFAAQRRGKI